MDLKKIKYINNTGRLPGYDIGKAPAIDRLAIYNEGWQYTPNMYPNMPAALLIPTKPADVTSSIPSGAQVLLQLGGKLLTSPVDGIKPSSSGGGGGIGAANNIANVANAALAAYGGFSNALSGKVTSADEMIADNGGSDINAGGFTYHLLNGPNAGAQRELLKQLNSEATMAAVKTGSSLGGSIGSFFGPIGSAIGTVGGGILGGIFGGIGAHKRKVELQKQIAEANTTTGRINQWNWASGFSDYLANDYAKKHGNESDQYILGAARGKDKGTSVYNVPMNNASVWTSTGIRSGRPNAKVGYGESIIDNIDNVNKIKGTTVTRGSGKDDQYARVSKNTFIPGNIINPYTGNTIAQDAQPYVDMLKTKNKKYAARKLLDLAEIQKSLHSLPGYYTGYDPLKIANSTLRNMLSVPYDMPDLLDPNLQATSVGSYNHPYTYGKPGEYLPQLRIGYSQRIPMDKNATGNSYPSLYGYHTPQSYMNSIFGRYRWNDPSNFEHFPYGRPVGYDGIYGEYWLPNTTVYGNRRVANNIPYEHYPTDYTIINRSTYPEPTVITEDGATKAINNTVGIGGPSTIPAAPDADIPSAATPTIAGAPVVPVIDPITGAPVATSANGVDGSTKPGKTKSPKTKGDKIKINPSDTDWGALAVNGLGFLAGYNQYVRGKKGQLRRPDIYSRNPYERAALTDLYGLRESPYPAMRANQDAARVADYILRNQGGLSAGQLAKNRVAASLGAQAQNATILNNVQTANNKYKANAAAAAMAAGEATRNARMEADKYGEDQYVASHGARSLIIDRGIQNMLKFLEQGKADAWKYKTYRDIMSRYDQQLNRDQKKMLDDYNNSAARPIYSYAPVTYSTPTTSSSVAIPSLATLPYLGGGLYSNPFSSISMNYTPTPWLMYINSLGK